VVITGCDSLEILESSLSAARSFKPLGETQVAELLAKTADSARDGKFEGYKTTTNFDGTAHNPQWLGGAGPTPAFINAVPRSTPTLHPLQRTHGLDRPQSDRPGRTH